MFFRAFQFITAIRKREVLVRRYDVPDVPTFLGDCMAYPQELEISVIHLREKPDFWEEMVKPRYADFPPEGVLLCFCPIPSSMKNTDMNAKRDK